MGDKTNSIFVALNDSISSRAVVDHLISLSLRPEDWRITLFHFFRKQSSSEELMGKKFTEEQPARMLAVLERARERLIENGFSSGRIETRLVQDPYPTVAEGIIDQFNRGDFNMVVIGRKRISKAEEFVMGDISVKLVRALEGTAVLVVKSR
ncbi:MAG: universal stress protein [Deltaproteobacteria bacterium]|nr:universal stress protein [Deltaproteobacteria bacterium]